MRLYRWRGVRAPLPHRIVKASLILATILVVAALGLDFIAPLFLNS
jgi:mercuric ion transport protein